MSRTATATKNHQHIGPPPAKQKVNCSWTPERRFARAMRDHSRYLSDLNTYIGLQKIAVKNELLKRLRYNARRRLLRQGRKVTIGLYCALFYGALHSPSLEEKYIEIDPAIV